MIAEYKADTDIVHTLMKKTPNIIAIAGHVNFNDSKCTTFWRSLRQFQSWELCNYMSFPRIAGQLFQDRAKIKTSEYL